MTFCAACDAAVPVGDRFCGECGTPVPTPVTVMAAVAAPAAGVDARPVGVTVVPDGSGPEDARRAVAPVEAEGSAAADRQSTPWDHSSEAPGKRNRLVIVGAAVAVLLAGGVGVWAFLGGGGAASPEAAVQELAAALSAEDALGVIKRIPPDELGAVDQLWTAVRRRLADARFAPGQDTLKGLDLRIENLELEVDEEDGDVALVEVRAGTIHYEFDPDQLTERARAAVPAAAAAKGDIDLTDLEVDGPQGGDRPLTLVTVRQGGGWYVSPLFTAAEYAAYSADAPGLDASALREPEPAGGESPDEAIVATLEAAADLDVQELGSLLGGGVGRLLLAYEDAVEDGLDKMSEEVSDLDIDVDDLEVRTEPLEGGRVKVLIDTLQLEMTATSPDGTSESVEIEFDGECLTTSLESAAGEQECISDRFAEATGITTPFVVMDVHRGLYRIDPLDTAVEWAIQMVRTVPEDTLLRTFGLERAARPQAALTMGEPTDGTLNAAGFAVTTFTAKADEELLLVARGNTATTATVYGPDGVAVQSCTSCVFTTAEAGEHRVLTEGDEGDEYALTVAPVQAQAGDAPGRLEGTTSMSDIAVYDLEAPAGERFTVAAGDSVDWIVADGGDVLDCGSDFESACELNGRRLIVFPDGDSPTDFQITLEQLPIARFSNGSSTAAGSFGPYDYDQVELTTERGVEVTLAARPTSSGTDLVVHVYDSIGELVKSVDDTLVGHGEWVQFHAYDDTYYVAVFDYDDGAGRYTLSVNAEGDFV